MVSSNHVNVTVNTKPSVKSQTANLIKCAGDSLTFKLNLTASPAPTYQWIFEGDNILNATNSSYYIDIISSRAGGNYNCIITNNCGSDTSKYTHLTINTLISILNITPQTTKCIGDSVKFTVKTTGEGAEYQWYKIVNSEQLIINNETNSQFSILK